MSTHKREGLMITGWIIEAADTISKDSAYKLFTLDKESVDKKRCELAERYDNMKKDRFRLTSNCPYTEIDAAERVEVKVREMESVALLFDLTPFVFRRDDNYFYVEVDDALTEEHLKVCER